ncbi:MAG TPA: ATP-binding protein [Bryobacteraceae bacterium]|nr:ATP-binding protein [Bryobacteraceae bacterium]
MLRSAKLQNPIIRYGLAVAASATMTVFAFGLPPLMNTKSSPFVIFAYVIAVLISAWWGGYGPGLLSALLMNFVSPYLLQSSWDFRRVEVTRLILTIGLSLFASYIASLRDQDEAELRASNEELEGRVQARTVELSQANEELRALADELRRSNHRLQQTNDELERFAYIASHDLQEPLRTMSIYAQLLRRQYGGTLGEEANQMLDFIRGGSARMQELVAAIMEFSRSQGHSPEFANVNVNSVLAVAKANLSSAIAEHEASIVADELPVLHCDPTHLARVFQNLISNALRFRSAVPPEIKIAAVRDANVWRFSVEDNGIGIAPEYKERIFHLFARLHPWTKIPGAGIGLAVCKRIIEHHGGTIWVESEDGRGSTFYFTVPAAEANVAEPNNMSRSRAGAPR